MSRRRADGWLALAAAVLVVACTVITFVRLATLTAEPIYPDPTSSTLWGPRHPDHRIDQP